MSLIQQKKNLETFASYLSFLVLGLSGLALNFLVSHFYGSHGVGILNQIFALYIVFSQFAVFGIHISAQQAISSRFDSSPQLKANLSFAALLSAGFFSLIFSFLMYLTADYVAHLFSSPDLKKGLEYSSVGLFFFSLNKVLLAILNGHSKNLLYFTFQAMRVVLMTITVLALGFKDAPIHFLGIIFIVSEALVFIATLGSVWALLSFRSSPKSIIEHSKLHIIFGAKSLLSNVFTELNTRIDILILGLFLSDTRVGVYSFVATLAEGIYQLPIFQRALFNPKMSALFSQNKLEDLKSLVIINAKKNYLIYLCIFTTAALSYPLALKILDPRNIYTETPLLFLIMLTGMYLGSGLTPFHMIFVQMNKPILYSIYMSVIVSINLLLNFLMIPLWGVLGATIATSISYASTAPIFIIMLNQQIKKIR